MPIINLTKQTIRIADENDEVYRTFEPHKEGLEVRSKGHKATIEDIPIEVTEVTGIKGLPEPQEGTYYIVPDTVARTYERSDLLTPDTGPTAIRNEKEEVYAVHRLFSVVRKDR